MCFLSLEEYSDLAEKVVSKSVKKALRYKLTRNEELLGEVASACMRADEGWKPDGGRTRESYRIFCGIRELRKYLNKQRKQPVHSSLDYIKDDETEETEDVYNTIIDDNRENETRSEKIEYCRWILAQSCLTPKQRKYIEKYFLEGMKYKQIAHEYKVSIQAVQQGVEEALNKIRQTVGFNFYETSHAV
jgi:RNA polymerase sigma factor (sigma-70 family)